MTTIRLPAVNIEGEARWRNRVLKRLARNEWAVISSMYTTPSDRDSKEILNPTGIKVIAVGPQGAEIPDFDELARRVVSYEAFAVFVPFEKRTTYYAARPHGAEGWHLFALQMKWWLPIREGGGWYVHIAEKGTPIPESVKLELVE